MPDTNMTLKETEDLYGNMFKLNRRILAKDNEIRVRVNSMNNNWDDDAYAAFKEKMEVIHKKNTEANEFLNDYTLKLEETISALELMEGNIRGGL